MSVRQHTPGPWAADSLGLVIDGPSNPNSKIVCDTTAGSIPLDQRKANARLIAAAPDMLAALDGLASILATAESNASGMPEWAAVSRRINAARAAIAKATGGEA